MLKVNLKTKAIVKKLKKVCKACMQWCSQKLLGEADRALAE